MMGVEGPHNIIGSLDKPLLALHPADKQLQVTTIIVISFVEVSEHRFTERYLRPDGTDLRHLDRRANDIHWPPAEGSYSTSDEYMNKKWRWIITPKKKPAKFRNWLLEKHPESYPFISSELQMRPNSNVRKAAAAQVYNTFEYVSFKGTSTVKQSL